MKVWVEQDLCSGDRLCEETCPEVFEIGHDFLAYVKSIGQTALYDDQEQPINQGISGKVEVLPELVDAVQAAADECPGECIFIDL